MNASAGGHTPAPPPATPVPDAPVAILILNWNTLDWTRRCLTALRELAIPRVRILVIDNGSEDGSPEALEAEFPEAAVLRAGRNLGVGGGRNLGAEYVLGEWPETAYLLFLDNDARPEPGALDRLVEAAEANPRLGVASGKVYYMDRPNILWSCGGDVLLHRADVKLRGMGSPDEGQFDEACTVDMVAGAAFFVPVAAWRDLGPFDPDFGLYFCEDTEWCLRAARRGYEVRYLPDAVFHHQVSKTAPGRSYWYLKGRNNFLLLKKHGKWPHWLAFPFFMAWALVRAAIREARRGNLGAIGTLLKGGLAGLRGKRP